VWTEDRIDLGAHWIHGTDGNPITTIARELGVPTLFVGGDSTYAGGWDQMQLRCCGQPLGPDQKEQSIALADEVRDAIETLRRKLELDGGPDISLAKAIEIASNGLGLTPELRDHVAWHMTLMARDDWGADGERLSATWWDEGYELYGYGDSVFVDGVGALIEKLAEGLDIRLSAIVRHIDHGPERVRVTTDAGPFEADAAIVTLPLGVLKSGAVRFDPPLPERKLQAIARLGMGSLTKVILTFERPFWPLNQYVFGHLSRAIDKTPAEIVNLWKTHRKPVLVMFVGGAQGRLIERWSDGDVTSWAMGILTDVFGTETPAPRKVLVTRWESDPYAQGCYSYLALGATPDDIDAIAAPVGERLLFAGEATTRSHWAAMQGAYVSGLREAARLTGDQSLLANRNFTESRRWREALHRFNRFFNMVSKTVDAEDVRTRIEVLANSAVFESISASDLKVLAMMFKWRDLADGDVLCKFGEPADSVFVIASGEIEVHLPASTTPVARRGRGDVVGENGMFLSTGRTATLVASGATRVLTLDYEHLRRFLLAFPRSMLSLFGQSVTRAQAGPLD
jgi:hypothetical protein